MKEMFKRTTIWLPIDIHTQAKMMAVLTGKSFSKILRIALSKEIKHLKAEHGKTTPKTLPQNTSSNT